MYFTNLKRFQIEELGSKTKCLPTIKYIGSAKVMEMTEKAGKSLKVRHQKRNHLTFLFIEPGTSIKKGTILDA